MGRGTWLQHGRRHAAFCFGKMPAVAVAAPLSRVPTMEIRSLSTSPSRVALIVGAGDSLGSAIALRFAREGFVICPVRRHVDKLQALVQAIEAEAHSSGQQRFTQAAAVVPFGVDCRKEEKVVEMIAYIEKNIGPIHVAVFNIGANIKFNVVDTTAQKYFKVWEMACFAGFLVGRETARVMQARQQGTILFTGATASVRGSAGFAAFAGAKHALRALAQSMARELSPQGIHVAHVVIDGGMDTPFVRGILPNASDLAQQDGLLRPDDIAENYWHLHQQPRSAWTHELDVRPWIEKW